VTTDFEPASIADDTARAHTTPARTIQTGTRATAFGLDVHADCDVPFLRGGRADPSGRTLELSVVQDGRGSGDWPQGAELICDQREPDGSIGYRIETHPACGYRIWGPGYGTHLLSADGRRLTSIPDGPVDNAGWQRLLIAQALPFAAVLRGLEVFHAGAVVLDGQALAFAGPSHAGKTSVVLELCSGRADFLADDVLALERVGGRLIAHPGTPLAGLHHTEAERLSKLERSPGEEVLAVNDREQLLRMAGATHAAPLAALFFLDRRPDGPRQPRFEPAADPQLLLTATFNFVLATPQRLRGLLDVCALAANQRVERVVIGAAADASLVAAAVRERLSGAV
jgi:hypothetical protein